ncbi:MAG TPA: DNA polymerase III subunit delta' C-terminal domain-containing protein [Balneolales bacterium]|nr:DNA polymerase III subunit delta' C-terminal domain-containing protein [Balneolales bacterium]
MTSITYPENLDIGGHRVVGQKMARNHLLRILNSGRLSHAYLFSGPPGIGKKALGLAFAEMINGINNLTGLGALAFSKKSSWFTHPDIHLFIPLPTGVSRNELTDRVALLAGDPYEMVDFGLRPALNSDNSSANRKAFYAIDYFSGEIKPAAYLKPNEGHKTIIVITNIEKMRKEAGNAFLKLLEEPSENLVFILTTDHIHSLLPTITSRCQIIPMQPLQPQEIEQALIDHDGKDPEDARYLSRTTNGNYVYARFFDAERLKQNRKEIIDYLRAAFTQDPFKIIKISDNWSDSMNSDGHLALLDMLETFIRDLMLFQAGANEESISNVDQLDVIQKFCKSLEKARLEDMIAQIAEFRKLILQNVQSRFIYTVMAIRFSYLMRGLNTPVEKDNEWHHIPAYLP